MCQRPAPYVQESVKVHDFQIGGTLDSGGVLEPPAESRRVVCRAGIRPGCRCGAPTRRKSPVESSSSFNVHSRLVRLYGVEVGGLSLRPPTGPGGEYESETPSCHPLSPLFMPGRTPREDRSRGSVVRTGRGPETCGVGRELLEYRAGAKGVRETPDRSVCPREGTSLCEVMRLQVERSPFLVPTSKKRRGRSTKDFTTPL